MNEEKFTGKAELYDKYRPSYPDSLIDWLYGKAKADTAADIGAGTGIFTLCLSKKPWKLTAVEPNPDMCGVLRKNAPFAEVINASAENTGIESGSVGLVTAAQAFHWFDTKLFKNECKRIIKEDGRIFLIWNIRDMNSELTQETYIIYKKYCPEFKGFGGGIQKDDTRIKVLFDDQYERLEYDNPLLYDRDKFINRSLLGSYSLKQNDVDYGNYINELELLFDKYSNNDVIIMPNKTIVYVGMCMGN